jgi:hypothetical protein
MATPSRKEIAIDKVCAHSPFHNPTLETWHYFIIDIWPDFGHLCYRTRSVNSRGRKKQREKDEVPR